MQAAVVPPQVSCGAAATGAMVAPDPAALVAAAVRAACLAKAPRRTVQGVAAAVVSVLMRPAEAAPSTVRGETARGPAAHEAVVEKSEEERREAVRAKRRLKRQPKKAARAAAAVSSANKEQVADEAHQGSAGDAETAEPAVEGASTPRRTTTPTFERGHTGLTPPRQAAVFGCQGW